MEDTSPSTPNQAFLKPGTVSCRKSHPTMAVGHSVNTTCNVTTRKKRATNIGAAAELQSYRHHNLDHPR